MTDIDWKSGDVAMMKCRDGVWRHHARPLLLIDPEDDQQVRELWRLAGQGLVAFQKRLGSMLPRPKLKEPMGLGAVVVDQEGEKWVRAMGSEHPTPWYRSLAPIVRAWPEVGAVSVLSKGYAS